MYLLLTSYRGPGLWSVGTHFRCWRHGPRSFTKNGYLLSSAVSLMTPNNMTFELPINACGIHSWLEEFGGGLCLDWYLVIRAKRVSNWYTPQKKSARLPACTCQIILVLVFTYVSTTYVRTSARYQPATKIRNVSTYVPGWGTYYVPHMFVNWCKKHVFLYLASAGSHDTYM